MDVTDIEKTNDSGIVSLAGFAYQIRVFVYYMAQMVSSKSQIEFETLEDVVVAKTTDVNAFIDKQANVFRSLLRNEKGYIAIQVKRTTINSDTKQKVLFNWLLLESSDNNILDYVLFTDKSYGNTGNIFDTAPEDLFETIAKSDKRSDALISKVKESYKNDYSSFEKAYKNIEKKYTFISEENLDEMIINSYALHFHREGVSELIYRLRVKEFIQNITGNIIRTIDHKKPYICIYKDMIRKIEDICDRIKDNKFEPDFSAFKKSQKINLADSTISESREYKQLAKCKLTEKRIEEHLIFQQYYESIRYRYLEDNKLDYIENIEETTYENFCDAKEYLKHKNEDTPWDRLNKTKEKDNYYAQKNQTRYGSCIYLTKETIDDELKISWEDES